MAVKKISIAREFSRYPAGRVRSDGPFSGEAFRDGWLIPILKSDDRAVIDLDGVRGYGSSFLEEAFGGLVREGFRVDQILSAFEFHSSDQSIVDEIKDYIEHGAEPPV